MKIYSAGQIRKWDAYTIAQEPVSSIDLMERAATACCKWLIGKNFGQRHFHLFCGKGNNGGDGLALARLLTEHKCRVTVYILEYGNIGTSDFQTNLERLHPICRDIHFLQSPEFFPAVPGLVPEEAVIIDAIIGTGLNKSLQGITAALAEYINGLKAQVISIDMPTGLYSDSSSKGNVVVKANQTLSFQCQKLAFLLPENEPFIGEVHILDIGLHINFEASEAAPFEIIDPEAVKAIYKPRKKFSHKGSYGHAALVSGSRGMMGAAILSSLACLHSGVGKLTSYIPGCGYLALQTAVPEAMCRISGDDHIIAVPALGDHEAVGIGPGIGIVPSNVQLLKDIFQSVKQPMLIDADALNIIGENRELLELVPPHSILTPHPKEFERLFGAVNNDFERIQLALQKSKEHNIHILLKGHYSFISIPPAAPSDLPPLKGYFNPTGNPGMAKAGSGDVLSGIITALLAQGYTPLQSCVLGTWLHGMAGDIAAEKFTQEAMVAGDIIACLPQAFKELVV